METLGDEEALSEKRSGTDTDADFVEVKKCSFIGSAGKDGDLSDVYSRIREPGLVPALKDKGYMSGQLGELQMLAALAATNVAFSDAGGFDEGRPSRRDTVVDLNDMLARDPTYQDMFSRRPSFVGMHDTVPEISTLPSKK